MRLREITGAAAAAQVWKQNQRSADALRTLRSKEEKVADTKASALAQPPGKERSRRLQAADRKDADARRVYGDTRSKANDRSRDAMAKRQ
jgi:hypothetical protein